MDVDNSRIMNQIKFIEQLDSLKTVIRKNLIMDESRRENSAEHSWHIATMSMVLAEYAPTEIDQSKVLKMLLLHDVIEIHAGDTFCFDIEGNKNKEERERRATTQWRGQRPGSWGDVLLPIVGESQQMFWRLLKGELRTSRWIHYEHGSDGLPLWQDWTPRQRRMRRCRICSRQAGLGDVREEEGLFDG